MTDREAAIREALLPHRTDDPITGRLSDATTALASLLAELAALRERDTQARADVKMLMAELAAAREREQQWPLYAHHIPGCSYKGGTGECDCGLRELEAALAATEGQE